MIYTAELPEGYALADGVKAPQIYVMVGKQARAAADAVYVSATGSNTATGTQDAPFATIEKALADVNTGGTVYLMSDITAATTITVPAKAVTLTSAAGEKDFTIYRGSKTGSVILLSDASATLTLADIILDGQSGIDGLGGSFTDINAPNETLISVTKGTLNITDGTVIQNNNYKGLQTGQNAGGGVEIKGSGVANMNGGEISHNMGYFGGGVHAYKESGSSDSGGLFNLSGGVIKQNHAVHEQSTWGGGGVYVYRGKFVMTGGLITENTTPNTTGCLGGGFYIYSGSAELNGGEIINNTAQTSAGVGYWGGSLTFSGDIKIEGNTEIASGKESNFSVYRTVAQVGTAHFKDGAYLGITTNTAPTDSADVQIARGATAGDAKYFFADDKSKAGVIYCDGVADNCIGKHTHVAGTLWLSTAGKSTLEALTGITLKQTPNSTTPANYDGALTLPAADNRTYSIDGGATWKTPTAAETTAGKFNIAFTNLPVGHKFDVIYKLLAEEGVNKPGVPSMSAYVTLEAVTFSVITFDTRGGTPVADAPIDKDAGTITMPANPTWGDYTFVGWYTEKDGAGTEVTADTTHSASATVYAKWTKDGKTVRTTTLDLTASLSYMSTDGSAKTANPKTTSITDSAEGWSWALATAPTPPTLTLDGANINVDTGHAINFTNGTVELKGSNNLVTAGTGATSNGIENGGSMTLKGDGSLDIKSSDSSAIRTGWIDINGGTIKLQGAALAINSSSAININGGDIFAKGTGETSYGLRSRSNITITGGTLRTMGGNLAIEAYRSKIVAVGAKVDNAKETFVSGETVTLTQKDTSKPVVFSFGPSIAVAPQTGTATYGTAASPTFVVTSSNFTTPAFAPSIVWTSGSPTGVTPAFTDGTLTMTTTTATPAGEYKFKVVSAKTGGGNYESAEATLKVDKLTATITWGSTISFPYNGSAQAPTASVSNKVGSDIVTVTVTGEQTNVGSHTATADALAGAAAGNYAMPTTKPTQAFTITKAAYTTAPDAPDSTPASKTPTGITLKPVTSPAGETVQYAKSATNTPPAADAANWQDDTEFTGLSGATDYYFFARVKENSNHDAGTPSGGTKIKTAKAPYTGTEATAPDGTQASKTDTTITLPEQTVSGETVEYGYSTTDSAPTTWQDSREFKNLDPNKDYYFFARVKENDNHEAGATSTSTKITTEKSAYTGTQAAAPDASKSTATKDSVTIPAQTVAGETVEYGYSDSATGSITWQAGTTFSPLSADTEYFFFAQVKENNTHKAGITSNSTAIRTDLSDAQKVTAAKIAVDNALNNFTATNATDADAIIALANKAISDAGITGVTPSWDASGAFSKTSATEDASGNVTGKIKLTCGTENATSELNKTIAQLPSDPAEKVRLVKAAIEAALNAYTATNATTDADIKAIADKANTDSGVTGVTVAWKTPSDFNNKNSTNAENGKVTGTFDLSCTKNGSTVTGTVSVNRPIERSDEQKLADAKAKAEAALAAMTATNTTTADDVMTVVNNALSGTGVTAAWKTPSDFNKTLATESAAGNITGTIEFSLNSKKSETNANLPIARLVADKTALTNAIADANNAKIGITTNNGSPSSVSNGTKFVSDAEMKALTDAIAAAQTVANNSTATTAEVTAAANALNDAVTTFKAAIKTGTYTSSGGGGGSSSGGGSTTTPPTVVPPTTPQPNPPTTVETKVPATVDNNGNANVNVTDKTIQDAIDKAVAEAKKNGTSGNGISVVISVSTGGKDANTVTVNLPKTVQEKVIAGKVVNTVVVVDRPDIAINLNLASITEINNQAKADVQLSATRMDNTKLTGEAKTAIGNRPTFDLKATYASGTKSVSSFGNGSVTIELPYTLQKGEMAGGLYAVYVDGNGKVNYITNSSYDANAKVLRFATNHFSVYGIGYKAPTGFTDIANHWAKTDIEFVVNRGLFSGTSSTTFSPNGAMTRGMFVTTLGRLANADVSSYKTSSFSDVKADAYYMGYIEWASKNNIVKGIGEGKFAPDQSITREQMAVIIESYAKAIGYTLPSVHVENTFADNSKIGTWAKDSVKKVQMAGIISGKSNNVFDPQGTATRAEVSAVLHRFIELVITTDSAQGWMMNDSGKWMYYENGKAVTGAKKIGDETYTFDQYCELAEAPKNQTYGSYTVKKGDSFWKIAREQKCNMFELARINDKTIFSIIYAGDVLQIPQQ